MSILCQNIMYCLLLKRADIPELRKIFKRDNILRDIPKY